MKNYVIVCPTFKRMIYKISGILLGFLLILLNILYPLIVEKYSHFSISAMGACVWLITRAGYKKGDNNNEKN